MVYLKIFSFLLVLAFTRAVIPRDGLFPNTGLNVINRKIPLIIAEDENRKNCTGGQPDGGQPPNRADTTQIVSNLIADMGDRSYNAYIVPSADAHQSEYVSDADERRAYVSGFTGSAGTAVILDNGQRALWTDGRYFLQADDQLDCTWTLMRDGNPGVPTVSEWLISELSPGQSVAADARLIGSDTWIAFQNSLEANGIVVLTDEIVDGNDMVDLEWNQDGRPPYSLDPIFTLATQYTGKEWYDKITDIEATMVANEADAFVITALDEVAWTLNLRGNDIPYNPVFRSYIIIERNALSQPDVSLFVPDIETKVPDDVLTWLGVGACVDTRPCVTLKNYDDIGTELSNLASSSSVSRIMIPAQFSTSEGASYYIYNLIPDEKRFEVASPPLLMKASKNDVERQGMKNAHIKDAVALISFLGFLNAEISAGNYWTELSAEGALAEYRYSQVDNKGLSFESISAFGSNGAIIHYSATPETDTQITDQNLYLLDSGGQYLDGTTDVTRTLHFGTPTAHQIEAYTRVLVGVLDFGTVVFPKGYGKYSTDILGRRSLYSVGLDYRHGTSHGVGSFLNVHEASDVVYELGFHGSDEPGFYEDGAWGIRIENVIGCVNVSTQYDFVAESYSFETITLVPMEPKLIDVALFTKTQCNNLNLYNTNIRNIVGPELLSQDQQQGYDWMMSKTDPLDCSVTQG